MATSREGDIAGVVLRFEIGYLQAEVVGDGLLDQVNHSSALVLINSTAIDLRWCYLTQCLYLPLAAAFWSTWMLFSNER
jgi:hypothetical protein